MHRALRALALTALLALPLAAQQVHVVDAAGGGDFTSLQDAIDAAASGDTLLIEPGSYGPSVGLIVIDGKSLTLVGDGLPTPVLDGLTVTNLQVDQTVRCRGLTIGPPSSLGAGILVFDSAGQVWVEDCTVVGHDGFKLVGPLTFPGLPGLSTSGSALVVVRSVLIGGNGPEPATDGGVGLRAFDSDVALYECVVSGGDGGAGKNGGDALSVGDTELVLVDCTLVGGRGGDGCASAEPGQCQGGDGLVLDGGVTAYHMDTSISAGSGGTLLGGGPGLAGEPQIVTPDDAVETWSGAGRSLEVGSPVREEQLAILRYAGEPGDTFGVFAALSPGFGIMPGAQGVFSLGLPFSGPSLISTVTAPDGVVELSFRAWPLGGPGLESADVFAQCFVLTTGGSVRLSGPTLLTVLDSSF